MRKFAYTLDMDVDTDFLSRFIGTNIKITTINRCFQGKLIHIDAARAIILINVKDLSTGKALPGAKLFFGRVILKVETEPSDHLTQEQHEPESGNTLSQDDVKQALEPQEVDATAPPKMKESVKRIINCTVEDEGINYILIDQFQPIFGPAVASKSCVYIFDILLLGPRVFKNGLQMVLEDKGILKVVHDCRWLGNFLFHQYSVVLTNVFDTQVADVYLFSMETGGFLPNNTSTVMECLTRYLNMSSSQVSFLMYKQSLVKDNPNIWCDRPLPTAALKLLSLEVNHLLALRLAMLDSLLADYTLLVDGYLNAYCQGTSDVFLSTESTSSELPKELQQLCVLQQRRKEKALKEYQVNSQGFLIRDEM
ncbi:piRNA biogenesis protein EXD1 isoform X3 [Rhinoderma darwinii]|uniref:piRNA biogenesis protein EXD1 isoform X3 n=1 Tax=Rhinoderma darwinii TaxID=43563 RepID=UPI003F66DC75